MRFTEIAETVNAVASTNDTNRAWDILQRCGIRRECGDPQITFIGHGDYFELVAYERRGVAVPPLAAFLLTSLYELLPLPKAKVWAQSFVNSLQAGTRVDVVWRDFACWLLCDQQEGVVKQATVHGTKEIVWNIERLVGSDRATPEELKSAARCAADTGSHTLSHAPTFTACFAAAHIACVAASLVQSVQSQAPPAAGFAYRHYHLKSALEAIAKARFYAQALKRFPWEYLGVLSLEVMSDGPRVLCVDTFISQSDKLLQLLVG